MREAIDCVEPRLDNAPALAATLWLGAVTAEDDGFVDDDVAEDDEVKLVRFAHGVEKTEETDMPTQPLHQRSRPDSHCRPGGLKKA